MAILQTRRTAAAVLVALLLLSRGPAVFAADEAQQLAQRVTDFYTAAKSFSVDVQYGMVQPEAELEERRVVLARPNRLSVTSQGDSGAQFICDGKKLVATMPVFGQQVQEEAGGDFDSLLRTAAARVLAGASVAVRLAGADPLGVAGAGIELSTLEPQRDGRVLCDRLQLGRGDSRVVVWVQQGDQPLVRRFEWKLQPDDDDSAEMPMPVAIFDNWRFDADLAEDAFKLPEADGLELVESFGPPGAKRPDLTGPIPLKPGATTVRDFAASKLAFNRRTLVDAYAEHGSHNDAWDEQATQFLSEVARHFGGDEGFKMQAELAEMGQAVLALGCDDPMVQYCVGAMLQDAGSDDEAKAQAEELVVQSYAGLVERGYPANRRYAAANRAHRTLNQQMANSADAAEFAEAVKREALQMILQDDLSNQQGRQLLDSILEVAKGCTLDEEAQFYEAARAHVEQQPFIVNMIGGAHHSRRAWKARGTGWASSVSEEGWKVFAKEMAAARDCYEDAWIAAPDRPEPATEMIGLTMADNVSPPSEMRLWFDRAVEAQIDHNPAYHAYLYGLTPRWGGSFGQMYQFGLRCKQTERYDTDVPYMLCEALWKVARDSQNTLGLDILKRQGVYDEAAEVCDRYIAEDSNANWWRSVHLALAYCTEHWEDAERRLDELNGEPEFNAFARFPVTVSEVVSEVRVRTSPQAAELMEVLSDDDPDNRATAIQRLEELAEQQDIGPHVRFRLRSKLQTLNWLRAFDEGQAVALQADPTLAGWQTAAGFWTSEEDNRALRGVSSTDGVIAVCHADFGPAWELSGEWEYGESPYNLWDAGVFICQAEKPAFSVMLNPSEDWIAAGPYGEHTEHKTPLEWSDKVAPFRVRLDRGVVDVWIGDQHVVESKALPGWTPARPLQVGFGGKYNWGGSVLTFRNLSIKKID
ncbi:hypothetical protein KOR34_33250 [Posidoniimonas corsicana]|uniref:3-keto-disaccharide hydrolase domain-containing protein n=1 Tax=Posidoniimonas corsicana TaxID=1938618 RepID=A0A5C5V6C7_9BACT|nr:DUF2092 domain-containing protein [Posidoniimonas corsicana]TWT33493.1 hypothetical protein KOR34_33250 [Posidoniimonas corsicana]